MAKSLSQLLYHNKYVIRAASSAGIVDLSQFNVRLCLHDQCPRRVSVDVLVALLRCQNVLLCFPAGHLLPGAELLSARRSEDGEFLWLKYR